MTPRALAAVVAAALTLSGCTSTGATPSPSDSPSEDGTPIPSSTPSTPPGPEWDFYLGDGGQSGVAYADALARGDDEQAALLARIALTPQSAWFGAWTPAAEVEGMVDHLLEAAEAEGKPATMVLYAIPSLDCSFFAEGGLEADNYLAWIDAVARGIDGREPWVILEPDALAQMGDCEGQGDRAGLLAQAAEVLDGSGARVYLDVGHSGWHPVDEVVRRINLVGTEHLAGFSTNVSNYNATSNEVAYDEQIAAATGLHYVIDTGRNGNGSTGEWCNARGRALGEPPRVGDEGLLDAVLWIKIPGESDGPCNGGPAAGSWWQEVALELASNAAANEG